MPLPDVYIYNPTCDFAIANGMVSWQPNRLLQAMERDTCNLPQFFCRPSDTVLVQELPSESLVSLLEQAGFVSPHFRETDIALKDEAFIRLPRECIHPWGWSPAAHARLKPLKSSCSSRFLHSPSASWKPESRDFHSRITSLNLLRKILDDHGNPLFLDKDQIPVICHTEEEVEKLAVKGGSLMVKLPWSSSGRGVLPVTHYPLNASIRQQISGMLRDQRHVFAEPLLHKVYDLGLLYEITDHGTRFLGHSRFFTGPRGQYMGNNLNGYPSHITAVDRNFLQMAEEVLPALHMRVFEEMGISRKYQGPTGVDTMVYRDGMGKLRIQPCLEINWRYTMGHVSLQIEKQIHPDSWGILSTWYNREKTFREFVSENLSKHPIQMIQGKIASGFLPLTEFTRDNAFGVSIMVFNYPLSQSF